MTGLDTNVLVRVVTGDDERQLAAALEVLRRDRLYLAKTVLLETEWVLRHAYGLRREAIATTFEKLLGFRALVVEDRPAVLRALAGFRGGIDFADALHLASSSEASTFATLDRRLARQATEIVASPALELL